MVVNIMQEVKKGAKALAYGYEETARGALEAGVRVVSGFAGNPANGVINAFGLIVHQYDIHVEWSTNEKVAFELAWGASMCGQRSFCSVNMLGSNVLVDALRHAMKHGC